VVIRVGTHAAMLVLLLPSVLARAAAAGDVSLGFASAGPGVVAQQRGRVPWGHRPPRRNAAAWPRPPYWARLLCGYDSDRAALSDHLPDRQALAKC
jgi:hypothetical protein